MCAKSERKLVWNGEESAPIFLPSVAATDWSVRGMLAVEENKTKQDLF